MWHLLVSTTSVVLFLVSVIPRLPHQVALVSHLQVERVEPDVRIPHLQSSRPESGNLLIQALSHPADLALGEALGAHRLDELLDFACGDAQDIGFASDLNKSLFPALARLEEAGKVGALASLGDAQVKRAKAGFEGALAIAVAISGTRPRALRLGSAKLLRDFDFHELLEHESEHLAKKVRLLVEHGVAQIIEEG
tara:strand:+ start:401 stop:985 length:585 start_codon:yes stop_codon:yes gene_type:complete